MKEILKPRELANLCGISPDTVRSWCAKKQIKFATTAGGHKRFSKEDVLEFLKAQGFPLPKTGKLSPVRILVIDNNRAHCRELVSSLQKKTAFNVKEASEGYEIGRMVAEFDPNVLFLDPSTPDIDVFKICRDIQARATADQKKMIVISGSPDDSVFQIVREAGADDCVIQPFEKVEFLIESIRENFKIAG